MTIVRDTGRHVFLRATAGAGKTTTLVEAAWHLGRGVYFAYNRHAVADLQARLPPRMRALTLHAHGYRLLHDVAAGPVQLQDDKARKVAALTSTGTRKVHSAAARAWSIAREEHWLTPTADQAQQLADRAEWEGKPETLVTLIPAMHDTGLRLWLEQGLADFTDMLWLPVTQGYGAGSLPLALVDEAQDLTPLRQQYVLHLLGLRGPHERPGRLIFVGDSDQAIYVWSGADREALSRLKTAVDAVELPLSVSFRCPHEVVRYARAHSDFIQPAPGAQPGRVEHVSAADVTYIRGDVVLCRTNAPLIRLALELMAQQVSVAVTGRDLAQRLRDGLEGTLPAQGPFANDAVTERVRTYLAPLADPLATRSADGDQGAKRALTELLDVARCLRYIAWVVSRGTGEGTLQDALALLAQLCREDSDADVLLTSVHRAKGKEWPRVTILYPELMPMSQGDPVEERAVQFVAVTRAQQVLRFAYGQERWAAQEFASPGILPAAELKAPPVVAVCPAAQVPTVGRPTPLAPSKRRQAEPPDFSAPGVPPLPAQKPAVVQLVDPRRAWPLLGGETPIPLALLQERLQALAEEERALFRCWAGDSLHLLDGVQAPFVGIHLAHLELYERAARQARVAVPTKPGTGIVLCVYEGPLLRLRLARKIRVTSRAIRLALGEQEYKFDRASGELVDGAAPLTPFIWPADLRRLQAG
nr:UvrD-helicase domain-containing protein [Deinococcus betulae]